MVSTRSIHSSYGLSVTLRLFSECQAKNNNQLIRASSNLAIDKLNFSSKATISEAETTTSLVVPSRNLICRVSFISIPYAAVELVTSPLVGYDTENVARSPTAPLIGLTEFTKTVVVQSGLVDDVTVPFGLRVTVAIDPIRGLSRVLIAPTP
jgi:hypothetical protein